MRDGEGQLVDDWDRRAGVGGTNGRIDSSLLIRVGVAVVRDKVASLGDTLLPLLLANLNLGLLAASPQLCGDREPNKSRAGISGAGSARARLAEWEERGADPPVQRFPCSCMRFGEHCAREGEGVDKDTALGAWRKKDERSSEPPETKNNLRRSLAFRHFGRESRRKGRCRNNRVGVRVKRERGA